MCILLSSHLVQESFVKGPTNHHRFHAFAQHSTCSEGSLLLNFSGITLLADPGVWGEECTPASPPASRKTFQNHPQVPERASSKICVTSAACDIDVMMRDVCQCMSFAFRQDLGSHCHGTSTVYHENDMKMMLPKGP